MQVITVLQPGYPVVSFCNKNVSFLCLGRRQKYHTKELNVKSKSGGNLKSSCNLVLWRIFLIAAPEICLPENLESEILCLPEESRPELNVFNEQFT